MKRLVRFMATMPTLTATDANVRVNRLDPCNSSRLRRTLSLRASALTLGLLLASTTALAQTFQVDYIFSIGAFVGNMDTNTIAPPGSSLTRASYEYRSFGFPSIVSATNFSGGDTFGRLSMAFRLQTTPQNSPYGLPTDRAGGMGQVTFQQFGTWVGSGHTFNAQGVLGTVIRAEIRNATMVNLTGAPTPTTPNLTPYLWGGSNIDPTAFPTIFLSWNSGTATGFRGAINFVDFGSLNSPHSDRMRVRTILTILKNGNPFYTDTDEASVNWAWFEGASGKSASIGDSYALNIANDPNGTQYCIRMRVQVLHDGFRDNFASQVGTRTLYDQLVYDRCFTVLVPEPASMMALGSGLVGLLGLRRRKK